MERSVASMSEVVQRSIGPALGELHNHTLQLLRMLFGRAMWINTSHHLFRQQLRVMELTCSEGLADVRHKLEALEAHVHEFFPCDGSFHSLSSTKSDQEFGRM
eukprot:14990086-Alexandrium_andersonii.AAC.1